VAYNAPLDIIERIHQVDPSLVSRSDDYGATALHVGCLNGTSLEAVKFVMRSKKDLVTELDFDKRSALHHAVECACSKIDDSLEDSSDEATDVKSNGKSSNKDYSFVGPLLDVINEICRAAPKMVHVQDSNSGTPLDLVQIAKAKQKPESEEYAQLDRIYRLLSCTSVHIYLQKKKKWEMEGVERRRRQNALSAKEVSGGSKAPESTSLSSGSRSSFSSIQTPKTYDGQSCLMDLSVLEEEDGDVKIDSDISNQEDHADRSNDLIHRRLSHYHHHYDDRKMAEVNKAPPTMRKIEQQESVASDIMDEDC